MRLAGESYRGRTERPRQLSTLAGLRELVNAAPVTLLVLDEDGNIVDRSQGAERELKNLISVHGMAVVEMLREQLTSTARANRETWARTTVNMRGAQGMITLDVEVTPLEHGWAATYRDVTARERTAGTVETLAGRLRESGATLNELGTTLATGAALVSDQAQVVASGSTELSANIREIAASAGEAASGAAAVAESTRRATTSIEQLRTSSEQIGGIVRLISTIAGQTKLLALNATIEAARANEYGRGFGVVAEEVKSLAGRTAEATESVTKMISAVQAETESATTAIQEIQYLVDSVVERQSAIVSAVEEQSVTAEQISSAIDEVADSVREAAVAADSVHSAASAVDDNARQLSDTVAV